MIAAAVVAGVRVVEALVVSHLADRQVEEALVAWVAL